ncbi:MAG: MFS transporter, partial [Elusimicrobiota bacterium]
TFTPKNNYFKRSDVLINSNAMFQEPGLNGMHARWRMRRYVEGSGFDLDKLKQVRGVVKHILGREYADDGNKLVFAVPSEYARYVKTVFKNELSELGNIEPSRAYRMHILELDPDNQRDELVEVRASEPMPTTAAASADTGDDIAHPDRAGRGQVIDLQGDGTDDGIGHGTHVTGIQVGSGLASKGRFAGVNPGSYSLMFKVFPSMDEVRELFAKIRTSAVIAILPEFQRAILQRRIDSIPAEDLRKAQFERKLALTLTSDEVTLLEKVRNKLDDGSLERILRIKDGKAPDAEHVKKLSLEKLITLIKNDGEGILSSIAQSYHEDLLVAMRTAAKEGMSVPHQDILARGNREAGKVELLKRRITTHNMSLGGPASKRMQSDFSSIIDGTGVTLVASAGNSGRGYTIGYPAGFRYVISVAALVSDLFMSFFSSRGDGKDPVTGLRLPKPDVAAFGGDANLDRVPGIGTFPGGVTSILSQYMLIDPDNANQRPDLEIIDGKPLYVRMSGTSMSGPVVAGIAAAMHRATLDWAEAQSPKFAIALDAYDKLAQDFARSKTDEGAAQIGKKLHRQADDLLKLWEQTGALLKPWEMLYLILASAEDLGYLRRHAGMGNAWKPGALKLTGDYLESKKAGTTLASDAAKFKSLYSIVTSNDEMGDNKVLFDALASADIVTRVYGAFGFVNHPIRAGPQVEEILKVLAAETNPMTVRTLYTDALASQKDPIVQAEILKALPTLTHAAAMHPDEKNIYQAYLRSLWSDRTDADNDLFARTLQSGDRISKFIAIDLLGDTRQNDDRFTRKLTAIAKDRGEYKEIRTVSIEALGKISAQTSNEDARTALPPDLLADLIENLAQPKLSNFVSGIGRVLEGLFARKGENTLVDSYFGDDAFKERIKTYLKRWEEHVDPFNDPAFTDFFINLAEMTFKFEKTQNEFKPSAMADIPTTATGKVHLIVSPKLEQKIDRLLFLKDGPAIEQYATGDFGFDLKLLETLQAYVIAFLPYTANAKGNIIIEIDKPGNVQAVRKLLADMGYRSKISGIATLPPNQPTLEPLLMDIGELNGIPELRQMGLTGKGVVAVIIDDGMATKHPALADRVIMAESFLSRNGGEVTRGAHSTHVAGMIGAQSLYGAPEGVAPGVKFIALQVLDPDSGSGTYAQVMMGMNRAIEIWNKKEKFLPVGTEAMLVNMSLGGPGNADSDTALLADKIMDNNIFIAIAAGNSGGSPGRGTIGQPGSSRKALTVAAMDKRNSIASFSSRGPALDKTGAKIDKPDMTGYGVNIYSLRDPASNRPVDKIYKGPKGETVEYTKMSGTSMATPDLLGKFALLYQAALDALHEIGASLPTAFADKIKHYAMAVVAEKGNLNFHKHEQGVGGLTKEAMLVLAKEIPEHIKKGHDLPVTIIEDKGAIAVEALEFDAMTSGRKSALARKTLIVPQGELYITDGARWARLGLKSVEYKRSRYLGKWMKLFAAGIEPLLQERTKAPEDFITLLHLDSTLGDSNMGSLLDLQASASQKQTDRLTELEKAAKIPRPKIWLKNIKAGIIFATVNTFGFALIGLTVGFTWAGTSGLVYGTLISAAMALAMSIFSNKIITYLTKRRPLPKEEAPEVYEMIAKRIKAEEALTGSVIPFPKLFIVDQANFMMPPNVVNAFATGLLHRFGCITLTAGILDVMNPKTPEGYDALENVLGHELSHIINYDIMVNTLGGGLGGVLDRMSATFRSKQFPQRTVSKWFYFFPATALTMFGNLLTRIAMLSVGRDRESNADHRAAWQAGDPKGMIKALLILRYGKQMRPSEMQPTFAARFLDIAPVENFKDIEIFSTHPSIKTRVARLSKWLVDDTFASEMRRHLQEEIKVDPRPIEIPTDADRKPPLLAMKRSPAAKIVGAGVSLGILKLVLLLPITVPAFVVTSGVGVIAKFIDMALWDALSWIIVMIWGPKMTQDEFDNSVKTVNHTRPKANDKPYIAYRNQFWSLAWGATDKTAHWIRPQAFAWVQQFLLTEKHLDTRDQALKIPVIGRALGALQAIGVEIQTAMRLRQPTELGLPRTLLIWGLRLVLGSGVFAGTSWFFGMPPIFYWIAPAFFLVVTALTLTLPFLLHDRPMSKGAIISPLYVIASGINSESVTVRLSALRAILSSARDSSETLLKDLKPIIIARLGIEPDAGVLEHLKKAAALLEKIEKKNEAQRARTQSLPRPPPPVGDGPIAPKPPRGPIHTKSLLADEAQQPAPKTNAPLIYSIARLSMQAGLEVMGTTMRLLVADPAQWGTLIAINIVSRTAGNFFGGRLIGALGTKKAYLLSAILNISSIAMIPIAYLTMGAIVPLPILVISFILSGAGRALQGTISDDILPTAIMGNDPKKASSLMLRIYPILEIIGIAMPLLVTDLIAPFMGAAPTLFLHTGFTLLAAIMIVTGLKLPAEIKSKGQKNNLLTGLKLTLKDPKLRLPFAVAATFVLLHGLLYEMIAPMYAQFGINAKNKFSWLVAAYSAGSGIGALVAERLSPFKHLTPASLMRWGLVGTLALASLGFVFNLPYALLAAFIFGALTIPAETVINQLFAARAPKEAKGSVVGFKGSVISLGLAASAFLLGLGYKGDPQTALTLQGVALAAIAGAQFWLSTKVFKQSESMARETLEKYQAALSAMPGVHHATVEIEATPYLRFFKNREAVIDISFVDSKALEEAKRAIPALQEAVEKAIENKSPERPTLEGTRIKINITDEVPVMSGKSRTAQRGFSLTLPMFTVAAIAVSVGLITFPLRFIIGGAAIASLGAFFFNARRKHDDARRDSIANATFSSPRIIDLKRNLKALGRSLGDSPEVFMVSKPFAAIDFKDGQIQTGKTPSGTQAAISEKIAFRNKGLVITAPSNDFERSLARDGKALRFGKDIWVVYVDIPQEEQFLFADVFAEQTLWTLLLGLDAQGKKQPEDLVKRAYTAFQDANRRFAQATADLLPKNRRTKVLILDYSLNLVSSHLKTLNPNVLSQQHTAMPWPDPKIFAGTLEREIAKDMLTKMLDTDILGFQTQEHSENFIRLVSELLPEAQVDMRAHTVTYADRTVLVRDYPVSVDAKQIELAMQSKDTLDFIARLKDIVAGRRVILRVDRIDPSKGILEGLRAMEALLEQDPAFKDNVVFLNLLQPKGKASPAAVILNEKIKQQARIINAKYTPEALAQGFDGVIEDAASYDRFLNFNGQRSPPVILVQMAGSRRHEVLAAMALMDVGIVNPVSDGMNLVAKEMALVNNPASLERLNARRPELGLKPGVVVASKKMGSYAELKDGVIGIDDPSDPVETKDAIVKALSLTAQERGALARNIGPKMADSKSNQWMGAMIGDLEELENTLQRGLPWYYTMFYAADALNAFGTVIYSAVFPMFASWFTGSKTAAVDASIVKEGTDAVATPASGAISDTYSLSRTYRYTLAIQFVTTLALLGLVTVLAGILSTSVIWGIMLAAVGVNTIAYSINYRAFAKIQRFSEHITQKARGASDEGTLAHMDSRYSFVVKAARLMGVGAALAITIAYPGAMMTAITIALGAMTGSLGLSLAFSTVALHYIAKDGVENAQIEHRPLTARLRTFIKLIGIDSLKKTYDAGKHVVWAKRAVKWDTILSGFESMANYRIFFDAVMPAILLFLGLGASFLPVFMASWMAGETMGSYAFDKLSRTLYFEKHPNAKLWMTVALAIPRFIVAGCFAAIAAGAASAPLLAALAMSVLVTGFFTSFHHHILNGVVRSQIPKEKFATTHAARYVLINGMTFLFALPLKWLIGLSPVATVTTIASIWGLLALAELFVPQIYGMKENGTLDKFWTTRMLSGMKNLIAKPKVWMSGLWKRIWSALEPRLVKAGFDFSTSVNKTFSALVIVTFVQSIILGIDDMISRFMLGRLGLGEKSVGTLRNLIWWATVVNRPLTAAYVDKIPTIKKPYIILSVISASAKMFTLMVPILFIAGGTPAALALWLYVPVFISSLIGLVAAAINSRLANAIAGDKPDALRQYSTQSTQWGSYGTFIGLAAGAALLGNPSAFSKVAIGVLFGSIFALRIISSFISIYVYSRVVNIPGENTATVKQPLKTRVASLKGLPKSMLQELWKTVKLPFQHSLVGAMAILGFLISFNISDILEFIILPAIIQPLVTIPASVLGMPFSLAAAGLTLGSLLAARYLGKNTSAATTEDAKPTAKQISAKILKIVGYVSAVAGILSLRGTTPNVTALLLSLSFAWGVGSRLGGLAVEKVLPKKIKDASPAKIDRFIYLTAIGPLLAFVLLAGASLPAILMAAAIALFLIAVYIPEFGIHRTLVPTMISHEAVMPKNSQGKARSIIESVVYAG